MKQQTFSDIEYSNRRKKTRREKFPDSMDKMIPWEHWVDMIRPYYPSGKRGRPPKDIETMLRMYLMQNWFNLSDAAIEDAIYDSYAMRNFMHLDSLRNCSENNMHRLWWIMREAQSLKTT
ncbi:MAG: transposase [Clostridiales bacterium]|nr:transposase [Clostridiales bacterium]